MTDTRSLLKKISEFPDDLGARWYLAGVREVLKPKNDNLLAQLVSNLVWLVKHYPEDRQHREVMLVYPHPLYEKLKRAWKVELRRHPESAGVAINAGHAFLIIDEAFAERCYKKATQLCPTDADLWQAISHAYGLLAFGSDGTLGQKYARKSIAAIFTAMKCQGSRQDGYLGQHSRKMILVDSARIALTYDLLEEAIVLGGLLIKAAKTRDRESQPKAIRQHDAQDIGNAILGMVALRQTRIDEAVSYLDRIDGAVASEENVLLLANGLIRERQFAAVNRYIQLCRDAMQSTPRSDQDQSAKLADWQASLNGKRSVKMKPW